MSPDEFRSYTTPLPTWARNQVVRRRDWGPTSGGVGLGRGVVRQLPLQQEGPRDPEDLHRVTPVAEELTRRQPERYEVGLVPQAEVEDEEEYETLLVSSRPETPGVASESRSRGSVHSPTASGHQSWTSNRRYRVARRNATRGEC